jgi:hypothetical protein
MFIAICALIPCTTARAGDITLFVDGEPLEDAEVIIKDDRAYVPVRLLGEALGKKVTYNGALRRIDMFDEDGGGELRMGNVTLGHMNIQIGYPYYSYFLNEGYDDIYKWRVAYVSSPLVTVDDRYSEKESGAETRAHEFLIGIPRDIPKGNFTVLFERVADDGSVPESGEIYVLSVSVGSPAKPVIYLYPENEMDVTVAIDYNGELGVTYPEYYNGWSVTARPDGTLINHADGLEYSYLFWEGRSDSVAYDFSKGFAVSGADTAAFLRDKLASLGLTPREYNEFIVYWLPQMQNNPYNLITFQQEAYTGNAKLIITPEPDSMLRVFMAYKPLDAYTAIEPQELEPFERTGFTVVEWGGARLSAANE